MFIKVVVVDVPSFTNETISQLDTTGIGNFSRCSTNMSRPVYELAARNFKLHSGDLWYTTAKQDPDLYYLYSMTRLKQGRAFPG
jgi:hypothetical protein